MISNKSLNILYHHRTQGRGAEGVHITSIVEALEELGHTVKIISPPGIDPVNTAGNAPVDKSDVKTSGINTVFKIISKHIPNFIFELIEIFYNIIAYKNLKAELDNSEYDLIYERYAFYMIAGSIIAKKYNIPFVLEANEVNGIKNRARKQSFSRLCSMFEVFLFNRCKSILTVSSYLKNMMVENGVSENKIYVAPNAIDLSKFGGAHDNQDIINKLGLKNKVVIGFAGWFDDWDRLDLLINVFSSLVERHPDLKLLLVGDGDVLHQVRRKAKEYDLTQDVILTGAVDRKSVHLYLSLLDIAVITHSNDFGSPVVMFEFMGLKIPIVAPKLLPITDVLTDNDDALLFDKLDMDMLEAQLDRIIVDKALQNRLSTNAYTKLVSNHTWRNNAIQILESSGIV